MSGDKAYLTKDDCNAVCKAGGKAHFRIKSNTISNQKGSPEWKRMVIAQKNEDPEEIDAYLHIATISVQFDNLFTLLGTVKLVFSF